MIYGVSGHRNVEQQPGELLAFARLTVELMVQTGCTEIITGMALGWDLAVARAAFDLDVPYVAAIPFPQQPDRWPKADQEDWAHAVRRANRVDVLGKLPLTETLHQRSYWVVDHCEELWTLYDGTPSGTGKCVLYAHQCGRIVRSLWEPWTRFRAERT